MATSKPQPVKPIVWTIAGSDTSGGAGIQADLHSMQALGVHGCSVITALTAQNSHRITSILHTPKDHLSAQLATLENDFPAVAIKLGMIGSKDAIDTIASFLSHYTGFVVADPVLVSSCGKTLLSTSLLDHYIDQLLPKIGLLTPNLNEAECLLKCSIHSEREREQAAHSLLERGARSVLIKGGHRSHPLAQDYWTDGQSAFWLTTERIHTPHTHGTGCTLSASITACLGLGYNLKDALVIAKMVVTQGLRHAVGLGAGPGPVQHLGWPEQPIDLPQLSNSFQLPGYQFPAPSPIGFYPIVDRAHWLQQLLPLGIRTIQLRIKDLSGRQLEQEIQQAIQIAKQYNTQLFINDHWQLAIRYGAYGVHLGQDDIKHAAPLEALAHAGLRLGLSTHCYYEVARAHAIKPSYIACGPIFHTNSKPMPFKPQGLKALARWRRTLNYPLVAIGGINLPRAQAIMKLGITDFAVISAVTHAKDPIAAATAFMNIRV